MRAYLVGLFLTLAAFVNAWTGISILSPDIAPISIAVSPAEEVTATTTPVAATRFSELTPPKVTPSEPKKQEKRDVTSVLPLPVPMVPAILPPIQALVESMSSRIPPPATTSTAIPYITPTQHLPPLELDAIFAAVVKIECPSEDRRGKYVGSGFVVPGPQSTGASIVTAAHLLMASGTDRCTVIFSNKNRAPSHYFTGTIREDRTAIRRRHDEDGIDIALITLPPLAEYPEAKAVFPDAYPSIPYPVCTDPNMIGDVLYHFGYPSNFLNQSYLSKADGEAIAYADITGIEEQLNQDQTEAYKTPIFTYLTDKNNLHPYMASRVATFYGDSGGLAFNATKQCILGPQRGGTIGGGAGENVSIFPLLGWPAARLLLP